MITPLYGKKIKAQLENEGFEVFTYIYPAGEASKNTTQLVKIVEFMAESGLTREDIAVALGGGVCGDMVGFAASVFLRGIEFVQIPTSLLAQVDSSVGGKTAVDLPQGKKFMRCISSAGNRYYRP
jgi:3-dehydroquinate synthase